MISLYHRPTEPITIPGREVDSAITHVRHVEKTLGLEIRANPTTGVRRWDRTWRWNGLAPAVVSDDVLCQTISSHNKWVRHFCANLEEWSVKPPSGGQVVLLTAEHMDGFWHGLEILELPIHRWNREYCRERMIEMYEIMRGRGSEGYFIGGANQLSPSQASMVLWLVGEFLGINPNDLDMDVPKKWRRTGKSRRARLVQVDEAMASNSYDGEGYAHCEKCGPIVVGETSTGCPRSKTKCPLKRDLGYE